ncbi:MAG: glycosyltransferase family 9 protein [Alphaproteobacteria bacterium]
MTESLTMPQPRPQDVRTLAVIVGLDLVGDALMKLPFLRAARTAFPGAEISWITAQGATAYSGVLRATAHPYLDHIYEQPEWLPHRNNPEPLFAAPHFDVILDTRGRWRETLRARQLPHDLFLSPAARYLFSDRRPRQFWRRPVHIQDRLAELVRLAAGFTPVVTGGIAVPDEARQKAVAIMPPGARYVGLVPGAGNAVKIWPLENFIALAAAQAKAGRVPVFLLGPQEQSWLPELQKALPSARFPLQNQVWNGQMTLAATMAVGERLVCAVTNDNGTSHMLAAVDCPLVSLFGPTEATKLAPRVSLTRIVRAQDFGGRAMEVIPVHAVVAAVDEIMLAEPVADKAEPWPLLLTEAMEDTDRAASA